MKLTDDLSNQRWMYVKGILFVVIAVISGWLLITSILSVRNAFLLGLCIWSSCRAYYFAFYVIEHYIDPSFKFSSLIDFVKYLLGKKK